MLEQVQQEGADLGSAPSSDKKRQTSYESSEFFQNAFEIVPAKGASEALWALRDDLKKNGCRYCRSIPRKGWICSLIARKPTEDFLKTKGVGVSFIGFHDPYYNKSAAIQKTDDIWARIDTLEENYESENRNILVEERRLENEIRDRELGEEDPNVLQERRKLDERKARLSDKLSEIDQLRNSAAIIELVPNSQRAHSKLQIINLEDFLDAVIPPRKTLLSPWLPEAGVCMIFAKAGIGKTFLSLSVAYAVASGTGLLMWEAKEPQIIFFVDGEMPQGVLQERLEKISRGCKAPPPQPGYFRILTPDRQEECEGFRGIPDILTSEGQSAIEEAMGDAKLLFLDNLSSLCRSGRENDSEDIIPLQQWWLKLRKRGKSVIVVHHASKASQDGRANFRGTSRQIDIMDTVMALERPSGYSPEQGCLFEIHYLKNRGFFGQEAEPFEARLALKNNSFEWTYRKIERRDYDRVVELYLDGTTKQREIAEQLGIGLGTVNRHLKNARMAGDIKAS